MACISETSINHFPGRCCETSLPAPNVWQVVGKPLTAEDAARRRFQRSLRTFDHRQVVGLAPRLKDARDHADHKHFANSSAYSCPHSRNTMGVGFLAERAIPMQAIEIIAQRMKSAFVRAHIDSLMHDILADPLETEML